MAVRVMNETTEIRELAKIMALAPAADSLDDIFIAPTVAADGVSFLQTGREVVTVKNTHATTAFTFTLKSVADELNRLGDVGAYSLAAGESATILINPNGFKVTSTNVVTIVMSDVAVKVAVNRVPNIL